MKRHRNRSKASRRQRERRAPPRAADEFLVRAREEAAKFNAYALRRHAEITELLAELERRRKRDWLDSWVG